MFGAEAVASTSVHLPPSVVARLDEVAAERGTSRNRIILEACEALLDGERGTWPGEFFAPLPPAEILLLRDAGQELKSTIYAARREREIPKL